MIICGYMVDHMEGKKQAGITGSQGQELNAEQIACGMEEDNKQKKEHTVVRVMHSHTGRYQRGQWTRGKKELASCN